MFDPKARRKIVNNYLDQVRKNIAPKSLGVVFHDTKYVIINGLPCYGYYLCENNEIHLSTKRRFSYWFSDLVHEVCHYYQEIQKSPYIKRAKLKSGIDCNVYIDTWLSTEDCVVTRDLLVAIDKSYDIELDCEKRAIYEIKKFNLPIDLDEYIKRANVNLYKVKTVHLRSPKLNDVNESKMNRLAAKMPNTLDIDHDDYAQFLSLYQKIIKK